ncbi:unnamed protein product [Pleuronectes platessa]|uniref:Uncharacterized protein n=1 Tax=Pleuronectes platessa TaxID=8262 RepID=A0A9N7Z4S9_PLEPL|nr:unnamed protein product [Pleuronectes platessa]
MPKAGPKTCGLVFPVVSPVVLNHKTATVLSRLACDLLAVSHPAEAATSSADPAPQLRDAGTAFGSTIPNNPRAQIATGLSISIVKVFYSAA